MPRQVASLVLCAPVGFGRIALAEFAALPFVRQLASGLAPHVLANPFLLNLVYADLVTTGARPSEELRSRLAADAGHVTPGFRAAVEAVATAGRSAHAFHRRSVGYRGPVTAVWGDRDAIVPPSHRRGLIAALPQAHVQVWAGMGHHPQRERPQMLAELVAAASLRPHRKSGDCHRMVMDTETKGAYRIHVRPQTRLSMGIGFTTNELPHLGG
jgi:pimeloyl-ACP methyl ester carboxylesterase